MFQRILTRVCRAAGYRVEPLNPVDARGQRRERQQQLREEFRHEAGRIKARHDRQTREQAAALAEKYREPVFGVLPVMDLIRRLAECIDPTDNGLFNTSQLVHVLQVLESMEDAGVDEEMRLAALVHDLGKLLLLTDEAPENISCMNRPIGHFEAGTGLDNVVFPFNHDEFAWMRLRHHLPEHLAWLVRYHSIELEPARPLMNERDRAWCDAYLLPFRQHDLGSKSPFRLPRVDLDSYRGLVERYFPEPVPF